MAKGRGLASRKKAKSDVKFSKKIQENKEKRKGQGFLEPIGPPAPQLFHLWGVCSFAFQKPATKFI